MIKIDKERLNGIEKKYLESLKENVKKKLKTQIISGNIYEYLYNNFENLILGYLRDERELEGNELKSLDKIIEELETRYSTIFSNYNIYLINDYFNQYFYKKKDEEINVHEGLSFLNNFRGKIILNLEIEIFEHFLKNDPNKSTLKGILIHALWKKDKNNPTQITDDEKARLNKIIGYQALPTPQKFTLKGLCKISIFDKLKSIFNYDNFSSRKKLGRHEIIVSLGVEVCPYCQRNYISNYVENEKSYTTADLDHFYIKSTYPYLALSLYNFIPSCQICNSRMKLAIDFYAKKHLYPYLENFDRYNVKFTTNGMLNLFLEKKKSDFKVIIENNSKSEKVINSIKTFKLDKVYETSHNKYLENMIINIRDNPKNCSLFLAELFDIEEDSNGVKITKQERKKNISLIKKEFEYMVKEPYRYKIEQGEPLGKLTKDILEEFGIDI